eukprot:26841_1
MVPKEIMDVGIFAKHKFHPNKSVFHGRGEFPKAPPEPTREHQALWKTQLYPSHFARTSPASYLVPLGRAVSRLRSPEPA